MPPPAIFARTSKRPSFAGRDGNIFDGGRYIPEPEEGGEGFDDEGGSERGLDDTGGGGALGCFTTGGRSVGEAGVIAIGVGGTLNGEGGGGTLDVRGGGAFGFGFGRGGPDRGGGSLGVTGFTGGGGADRFAGVS